MCCWAQSKFPGLFIGLLYLVLGKSPRGMKIAAKSKRSKSLTINNWPRSSRQTGGLPGCRSSSRRWLEPESQIPAAQASSGRLAGWSLQQALGWEVTQVCWVGGRKAGRESTPKRGEERISIQSMRRKKHLAVTESGTKAHASTQLHGPTYLVCV